MYYVKKVTEQLNLNRHSIGIRLNAIKQLYVELWEGWEHLNQTKTGLVSYNHKF